jgi:hypothetical protein
MWAFSTANLIGSILGLFQKYRPRADIGQPSTWYRVSRSGFPMTPERYPSFTASSAVAAVACGLRVLRGLGYAADSGRRNSCSPTFTWGRTHAVAGHAAAGRGMRWKLSCATQVQRAACRLNMSGSRIQLPHAVDFLAHSFECGSEHLFALQGMLSCAGKAPASWCSFSARGPDDSRGPTCVPYRAYRADAGATPQGHQVWHHRFRDGDCVG